MCEDTPDADWEPFYFTELSRFKGINKGSPLYGRHGVLESCPSCTEIRVRLVDPMSWPIKRGLEQTVDLEAEGYAPVDREEKIVEDDEWGTGESGVDLDDV